MVFESVTEVSFGLVIDWVFLFAGVKFDVGLGVYLDIESNDPFLCHSSTTVLDDILV